MASILVCYGTGEGQTEKVADRIARERRRARPRDDDGKRGGGPGRPRPRRFDAVLVGASVHHGRHQKAVRRFARTNRAALATKQTGFFQVSWSSAEEEGAAEATKYVEEFVDATNWRPDRIGLFGGAIRFSEYGFLTRGLMKLVARSEFPEADTSADVEFTDWDSVAAFAEEFAAFVEDRAGEADEDREGEADEAR